MKPCRHPERRVRSNIRLKNFTKVPIKEEISFVLSAKQGGLNENLW